MIAILNNFVLIILDNVVETSTSLVNYFGTTCCDLLPTPGIVFTDAQQTTSTLIKVSIDLTTSWLLIVINGNWIHLHIACASFRTQSNREDRTSHNRLVVT